MDWLVISLTVSGEMAEAVADVLGRYVPNGVSTEQGVKNLNEEDEGTPEGPITVRAYLPMDGEEQTKRRQIEEALYYLGRIQPLPAPTFTRIADQNWMEAWKQHYKPIQVGCRLLVVPAWLEMSPAERIAIRINPGMAFGTGTHPSTQLCLELIERNLNRQLDGPAARQAAGAITFIDVGCGSGILCVAALKLGASLALGVDIDPDSLRNARENAAANGIGAELELGVGSVEEILAGKFAVRESRLVCANILAPVIVRLLSAGLADLVAPGGTLLLGGVLKEQGKDVLQAAQASGFRKREERQMGEWLALDLSK